jgi:hypothetical protein
VFHCAFVRDGKAATGGEAIGQSPDIGDGSEENCALGERSPIRDMKAVEAVPPFGRCKVRTATAD